MPDRAAIEGFPVWFDSTDAGLRPEQWTTFQVQGGKPRAGYRTAFVFPPGTFRVTAGNVAYDVRVVAHVAPKPRVRIARGTTEAQLAALLADDTDYAWDADAVVTLTKILPLARRNVRWLNPRLHLAPATHASVLYVDITAPGFRVDDLTATASLPWAWVKEHTGTADVFRVRDGGQLVCRRAKGEGFDTFCWVTHGAAGVVIENLELKDTREYVLYQNGSDAGTSLWKWKVDAHGYEPFVRFMDHPDDNTLVGNCYVGYGDATRRDADPPIGKDGITPRGCRRVAADSNVLRRCQFRSGQDQTGIDTGGSDPTDVLAFGNEISDAYLHHREGNWKARRIHFVGNRVIRPFNQKPVMYSGVTDGTVADNVWVDGPATWAPSGSRNTNCRIERNGNGGAVDPRIAQAKADLLAVDGKLADVARRQAAIDADREALTRRQAEISAERDGLATRRAALVRLLAELGG